MAGRICQVRSCIKLSNKPTKKSQSIVSGLLQRQRASMAWYIVDILKAYKINVDSNAFWSPGLGVCLPT